MKLSNKPSTKITSEKLSQIVIKIDAQDRVILGKVVNAINENHEIKSLWKVMNVNAIDRLKMTDHGPTHFQIVAVNALKIARILEKKESSFLLSEISL